MILMFRAVLVGALACVPALTAACHEFAVIGEPGCGNGVLEPALDEDCDTHGVGGGTVCGERGSDGACRFVCGDGDVACPVGWACGDDGVCRHPGGTFDDPSIIAVPGALLATGDVDADGRVDLVSFDATTVTVAYGDADGRFLETSAVPAPPADEVPVLEDLDGDGADDVALPLAEGVQLFRGSHSRELLPTALAEGVIVDEDGADVDGVARVVAARVRPPFDRRSPVAVIDSAPPLFVIDGAVADASAVHAMLPAGALARRIAAANLDDELAAGENAEAAADELALATVDSDAVVVVDVQCPAPPPPPPPGGPPTEPPPLEPCTLAVRQVVRLLGGERVHPDGPVFADLDGDGDLDLFVGLQNDAAPPFRRIAVARADDGVFADFVAEPGLDVRSSPPAVRVLAIADVDGDRRADVIGDGGVFLQRDGPGGGLALEQVARAVRPWTSGVVIDVNGDDRVDVVGGRPGVVDVLLASDTGRFNALRVPLTGVPQQIAAGDFDGDFVQDLVVLSAPARVTVLYSGARGVPDEAVVQAELPRPGAAIAVIDDDIDDIDDVVAVVPGVDDDAQGGEDLLVHLQGTSARRLVAPLPIDGPVFAAVTSLRFAGTGTSLLVIGITGGGAPRRLSFRVLDGDAATGAAFTAPRTLADEPGCGLPTGIGILVQPADLDGDDVDELLLLEAFSPEPDTPVPEAWRLFVLRPDLGDAVNDDAGTLGCQALAGAPSLAAPRSLVIADVDGDGRDDAVALLDPTARGGGPAGTPALAVWWGDDSATRLATTPDVLSLDDIPPSAADPASGVAFAALQLDGDDASELLLHNGGALFVLDLAGRTLSRDDLPVTGGLPPVSGSAGAAGVVGLPIVNDVDGDGLDDVIIGTAGATLLLRQRACSAARADAGLCARGAP